MEIVILSGKGGTGKTTIATALSDLAKDVVRVDCDVDAPNFYLYYEGEDIETTDFIGGKKAFINGELCKKCGRCESICRFNAIENFKVNSFVCEGCGACKVGCKYDAITLKDEKIADTFITKVDEGFISRAQMEIGADGSGKLITNLRKKAKERNIKDKLTIIDGSPGIGCPVISSITGSNSVLVVTEPTKSGLADLKRVVTLCEHFGVLTMICINKFDINEEVALMIENYGSDNGIQIVGKIPYDDVVRQSINDLKPITTYKGSIANEAIKNMWDNMRKFLK